MHFLPPINVHQTDDSPWANQVAIAVDLSRGGCVVGELDVNGHQVLGTQGAYTGIEVNGTWYTSAKLDHKPKITDSQDEFKISGIEYGGGGVKVDETWIFETNQEPVKWKIIRYYKGSGEIQSTAMPALSFTDMST